MTSPALYSLASVVTVTSHAALFGSAGMRISASYWSSTCAMTAGAPASCSPTRVARAVADARGGGASSSRTEAKALESKHVRSERVLPEAAAAAGVEKTLLEKKVTENETPSAGAAHPEDPEDRRDPLQTRYASVTPRARSRASLRASRGAARPQSPGEDTRSPGTELRRRAIAMGMRASPFAPKRKR